MWSAWLWSNIYSRCMFSFSGVITLATWVLGGEGNAQEPLNGG
jgi:hypothetical protein